MDVIHTSPQVDSYTPISEHQSQTPESFYDSKPVLHHHTSNARLVILDSELRGNPALYSLVEGSHGTTNGNSTTQDQDDNGHEVVISDLDIWVASDKFTIYASSKNTGVSIPYPAISLHAIQRLQLPSSNRPAQQEAQGLFMQLSTSNGFDDHDPDGALSLTLIPSMTTASSQAPAPVESPESATPLEDSATSSETPIQTLFSAVSACANLHPDPLSESENDLDLDRDEDGDQPAFDYEVIGNGLGTDGMGLPPPMPGSGGWITAENVGEFFDEEGNWRGGGLGPGAGMVREREDGLDTVNGDGMDGGGENGDGDTKWRRTED